MRFVLLIALMFLSACASVEQRREFAAEFTQQQGFSWSVAQTQPFHVAVAWRGQADLLVPEQRFATIYLEGDGFAWKTRYQPSKNPTPKNPLALKLAGLDTANLVGYLARPCQFVQLEQQPKCTTRYWTSHRYSPKIRDSLSGALTQLKQQYSLTGFDLVGYSGGGTLAVLLAHIRDDVRSVRTVAGNIMVDKLAADAGVTPLFGSLDPADIATEVDDIPQIHYSGADDDIVPAYIAQAYKRLSASACVQARTIKNASHHSGWQSIWAKLVLERPSCQ